MRSFLEQSMRNGPLLLLGDLNAHHQLWGNDGNSPRGRALESIFDDLELICLNDGSFTFISSSNGARSAIDLVVSSPQLVTWFQFTVDSDPGFSDHFPIVLHLTFSQTLLPPSRVPCWSLKNADWDGFRKAFEIETDEMVENDISDLLCIISKAASDNI